MEELRKEERMVLKIIFHGGAFMFLNCGWDQTQTVMSDFRNFLRYKYGTQEERNSMVPVKINYFFMSPSGEFENMIDFAAIAAIGLSNVPKDPPSDNTQSDSHKAMANAFVEYVKILKKELGDGEKWRGEG